MASGRTAVCPECGGIRSLPGAPSPCPVGAWLAGELPQAIEAATSSLDPGDCDRMDSEGVMVDGTSGVDEEIRSSLAAVPCAVQDARWLTLDQQLRLVAVASLVTGAARLLAEDPGTAITTGELSRMWALLDHAIA